MMRTHAEAAVAEQRSLNAAGARQALRFADVERSREHESLGFASISSWARATQNLHPDESRSLLRVGRALRDLPLVREAALAGELTFRHLKAFEYGLRIVGRESTLEAEEPLLEVATSVGADDFHNVLRRMHEAAPDLLDEAWKRGMDKQDLSLAKTLEGWHLAGFLPIDLGTKLKTILDAASIPREANDTRRPAERRIENLEALCDSVLEHGLPTQNGIKPQLRIVVDVDNDEARARLAKFGAIGPSLAAHLACEAEWLTIKTRNREVLDVGRRRRFATAKQTEAILHMQDGVCAGVGCRHPIAHIHHKTPWSFGGRTDIDDLIGYCSKCHTLEHDRMLRDQPALARAG